MKTAYYFKRKHPGKYILNNVVTEAEGFVVIADNENQAARKVRSRFSIGKEFLISDIYDVKYVGRVLS